MNSRAWDPDGLDPDKLPSTGPALVPAAPCIDHVIDTAPPWTMPALPGYLIEPVPFNAELRPTA